MDSTLVAGIIGGICTVTAGIIAPLAQKIIQAREFYPINFDRRKILHGKWKGVVHQHLPDKTDRTFNVDIDLKIKGKRILGSGIINAGDLLHVSLEGSFRNDQFLKMDYQNKDSSVLQFGSFVFHLAENSKTLIGKFVGYGYESKTTIYGVCKFIKS